MNNLKSITSTIQKKNKSLKLKIDKNFPKMVNTLLVSVSSFYTYWGTGHEY